MMFALCLKIPTIFLEMIICWTTDLPTFSVLPFLLISYQSVVTSWRGILTDVKYIEKWQSIPVALVFCINHYITIWNQCLLPSLRVPIEMLPSPCYPISIVTKYMIILLNCYLVQCVQFGLLPRTKGPIWIVT